jgi:hypothetical protein
MATLDDRRGRGHASLATRMARIEDSTLPVHDQHAHRRAGMVMLVAASVLWSVSGLAV